jgi:predicted site-specific integrase-resolvase
MIAISPAPTDRLWTLEDIARFFQISVCTARGWHRDGQIPRGRKIGRRWLWNPDDVRAVAGARQPREFIAEAVGS